MEERGADRGAGDSEGVALHKEDVDGELLKAFMTTDASAPDVPIVDTSPGFQVGFCMALKTPQPLLWAVLRVPRQYLQICRQATCYIL